MGQANGVHFVFYRNMLVVALASLACAAPNGQSGAGTGLLPKPLTSTEAAKVTVMVTATTTVAAWHTPGGHGPVVSNGTRDARPRFQLKTYVTKGCVSKDNLFVDLDAATAKLESFGATGLLLCHKKPSTRAFRHDGRDGSIRSVELRPRGGVHPMIYMPTEYMRLALDDKDAGWQPVVLDSFGAAAPEGSFEFGPLDGSIGSGLQWVPQESASVVLQEDFFAGWYACDWAYGKPQLFWADNRKTFNMTSNCAKVDVHRVMVDQHGNKTLPDQAYGWTGDRLHDC